MDINYGKTSLPAKAKRWYQRKSTKAKAAIWAVSILLVYYFFIRNSATDDVEPVQKDESDSSTEDTSNSQVKDITLSYLSMQEPFIDQTTLKFYNYINGGNMQLEKNAEYIRLTEEKPHRVGYLFAENAISHQDTSALEINIEFKLHGEQKKSALIGDGMAIWLTDKQLARGDVFGMQSDFNGLGLFIDTYRNADKNTNHNAGTRRFPYLTLQPNDGNPNGYDKSVDGYSTELGGCSVHKIYNNGAGVAKLKVIYIRKANFLQVDLDSGGDKWITCVRRSDVPPNVIPDSPYLGVSAETGDLFEAVDIYSISVHTYRKSDGSEISSIDEMSKDDTPLADENGDGIIDEKDKIAKIEKRLRRHGRYGGRHGRRALARVRRQERLNRERNLEVYGSEDGFFGWFFGWVWWIIKGILYTILACVLGYILVVLYRVWKEKQREKRRGGLL